MRKPDYESGFFVWVHFGKPQKSTKMEGGGQKKERCKNSTLLSFGMKPPYARWGGYPNAKIFMFYIMQIIGA